MERLIARSGNTAEEIAQSVMADLVPGWSPAMLSEPALLKILNARHWSFQAEEQRGGWRVTVTVPDAQWGNDPAICIHKDRTTALLIATASALLAHHDHQ